VSSGLPADNPGPSAAALSGGPSDTFRQFGAALNQGDLAAAASCFARDGCFLTPDSTVIRGREEIRAVLAQLTAMRLQLQVGPGGMLTIGDVALSVERLTMRLEAAGQCPFVQSPRATVILRHIEEEWKLLFLALWGVA
jgi:uncharacterized protein (TIGR02246 family)